MTSPPSTCLATATSDKAAPPPPPSLVCPFPALAYGRPAAGNRSSPEMTPENSHTGLQRILLELGKPPTHLGPGAFLNPKLKLPTLLSHRNTLTRAPGSVALWD